LTLSEYIRRRRLPAGAEHCRRADHQRAAPTRRLLKHTHNQTGGEHSKATAAALAEITAAIKRIGN